MPFSIVPDRASEHGTVIKVVGVGGAGGNAVNRMIEQGLSGVEYIACNTDRQVLEINRAETKIVLGTATTRGLGAGGNPEVGAAAAEEDKEAIKQALTGADMVFITAGMGGGTGTGAAPIVAKIAKECGALTVAVVTKPFEFEGKKRMELALQGIERLRKSVDTIVVIPNQKVLSVLSPKVSLKEAFLRADDVLRNGIKSIVEIITVPGMINIDFADVRATMEGKGEAVIAVGYGKGENKVSDAAESVLNNPFLDGVRIEGATRLLINVVAPCDVTIEDYNEINNIITTKAHPAAHINSGLVYDDSLADEIRVMVFATGFEPKSDLGLETQEEKSSEQSVSPPRSLNRSASNSQGTSQRRPTIYDTFGSLVRPSTDVSFGSNLTDPSILLEPSIFRMPFKSEGKN